MYNLRNKPLTYHPSSTVEVEIITSVPTCNSIPISCYDSQPGQSGMNFSRTLNSSTFCDPIVQSMNLLNTQGGITQSLLDIPVPRNSEMSNPEKIKNQFLVPVKSVSDTALYSNNHKSNEDENHLILMLREELKSTKDQYNSLKNSMSQATNNEIEGLKLELEKLREEKISQNSSCQTVNGTIPSVLQAPQQQEINSANTVRITVTPTTIMSSQHQGTRTGTHTQFIQQGSAATITSSHSQLCSSMQTGSNRQPYQSESSYQSEPLSLAPNYRNAKQQQNLGYSAPFSIQNGLASHQLTRQREDNSDIRQQEYGRRTRVPCYNGKEPWSAYQMQF